MNEYEPVAVPAEVVSQVNVIDQGRYCAWCNPSHEGEPINASHGMCNSHFELMMAEIVNRKKINTDVINML